ncbi:MAG: class I SAM-dependent methyltransferase [Candidatus Parabeggiatoa sp. nov. 1]|nr:MAG: class I SAM-dependent methyltransferase [Gammaproteobacteria bacterium]
MSQDEKKPLKNNVKPLLKDELIELGSVWSYNLWNDPKRLAFVLARYKFAAEMGCKQRIILELGCSEGIGSPILGEFAKQYTGIDMDKEAIVSAKKLFGNPEINFIEDNFLGNRYGTFETVISLDVIEHIQPDHESLFFDTIIKNLGSDGIGIVGTPNLTSVPYASPGSQVGHVNMFSAERLKSTMGHYFHNVFIFGINDEIVHTGFAAMAHYLICVGCYKK